jgi:hypothetical protein
MEELLSSYKHAKGCRSFGIALGLNRTICDELFRMYQITRGALRDLSIDELEAIADEGQELAWNAQQNNWEDNK